MSSFYISPNVRGLDTQIQYNEDGVLSASSDLTWDDATKELGVGGDINLDDGGTYATTLQLITPTANRTISFPDATGTVALVAGSSRQLLYNNAGANGGVPSSAIGASGDITLSLAGAASTPPVSLTGTWFSGGTSTTTKPQFLIEPTGTTSTAWSTSGTGLGVNAASGFAGRLFDFQVNGSSRAVLTGAGLFGLGTSSPASLLSLYAGAISEYFRGGGNGTTARDLVISATTGTNAGDTHTINASGSTGRLILSTASSPRLTIDSSGNVGVNITSPGAILHTVNTSAGAATVGAFIQNSSLTAGTEVRLGFAPNTNLVSENRHSWIAGVNDAGSNGSSLTFATNPGGQGATERMRIDSSGRLLVGTSTYSGNSKVAVADSISVLPASYDGASEISSFKALTLASIAPANQLRVTFTLPTNITGYGGFFVAELLVKALFDNASFPELGGIYKIRVGGVSTGTTTATSFLTTEVLYTASTQGNWTAITTGDVAVNAVSGTELTLDIDNPGGANYRYNVFTQYAHNCSNIALSSVAA